MVLINYNRNLLKDYAVVDEILRRGVGTIITTAQICLIVAYKTSSGVFYFTLSL